MIGKLKGTIDTIEENQLIIDVGGVGYQVFASSNTLRDLPQEGGTAELYIETHVREDHIHLYGFSTAEEKQWFNILNTVNGVGTKVGLAILSVLSPEQVQTAIAAQDKSAFTQVSGVGPRLGERIVTELKGKVEKVATGPVKLTAISGGAAKNANSTQDAISALTNLGYNRSLAYGAVQRVISKKPNLSLEELIREGLKELSA